MSFPSDGRNHRRAIQSEQSLDSFVYDLQNIYGSEILEIVHRGGTQNTEDNIIRFATRGDVRISLKLKSRGPNIGSLDYVNTSAFDKDIAPRSMEIYNRYRGTGNINHYRLLKTAINDDLDSISDDFVTDFFVERVLKKYTGIDLIIIDGKNGTIHRVVPVVFDLVESGGKLRVKRSSRGGMSRQLVGVDTNGTEMPIHLRLRLHLNNGKTKWLSGDSSSLVLKFQQDKVGEMV